MREIKVLGMGCPSCTRTIALIEEVAAAAGVDVHVEKVDDLPEIMGYGIASTPGVVVDGDVVHAGGIPSRERITAWLTD